MIPLGPVTSTLGTTYSAAQVQGFLFQPSLAVRWAFDLLDARGNYKADLTPSIDGARPPVISHDSTRAVKRQLRLTMRAVASANVFQDLVRVRFQIIAPDGGLLEWRIGLFMLVPPDKDISEGYTWWTLTAPDLSQLLSDAAFTKTTAVAATSSYAGAIQSFIMSYGGSTPLSFYMPDPGVTLPASLSWDPGVSVLKAVNDLLGAVNYVPGAMSFQQLTSKPIPDYTKVQPVLTLNTGSGGAQVVGPFTEKADYSTAFNQILVVGEDPRRVPVSYYYENRRPDSPVSLENWHPRLLYIRDSTIPSVEKAKARALTEAGAAARIYSTLTVGLPPWPFFEDLDVVNLIYTSADEGLVDRNFLALGWNHVAAPGVTNVSLQRIVAA